MKSVTLRIRRDGTVEAETHGIKGRECLPHTAELERLLDAEAVDSEYTPEFYERVDLLDQEAPSTQQEGVHGNQ